MIGLFIGKSNVRPHFPASLKAVEIELDHLRIRCELQPSFWCDLQEITDPRLCVWLLNKSHGRAGHALVGFAIFGAGESSFRLQVARSRAKAEPGPPACAVLNLPLEKRLRTPPN